MNSRWRGPDLPKRNKQRIRLYKLPVRNGPAGTWARLHGWSQTAARLIHVNALLTAAGTNAGHGQYPTNDGAAGARPDPGCRSETTPRRGAIPHALPQLRGTAASLQSRMPRRREHPGLAGAGAGRRLPPRVGDADGGQSVAGDPRPGLLPPVRNGLQPRGDGLRGVDPHGRALSWRHGDGGTLDDSDGARDRQANPGGRRRPERSVGRLSPGQTRPSGRDPRGRPAARRHAAFRHPGLPPAARRSAGGDRPHRADGRAHRAEPQGHRPAGRTRFGPLRRGVRRDRSARRQARRHPRARRGAGAGCGGAAARHRHRQHAAARSPGGGVRRWQHGDGCRAEPPPAGGRRGADRLSPRPGAYAGA